MSTDIDFYQMDEDDPRALISKYMLHTYNMGLTTTSGGNLSVFDKSGRIFITPGGTDKGVMTPEDIVVVEKDGSMTGGHKPSSELPFHKRIYASNSEFRAVLHAHSPEISAFSAVRVLPDSTIFSGSLLVEKKIVMAEYELTGSEALGEVIFKKFREGADIVVMENHGMISAAKTMREAYGQFEALEFAAHTHRLVNCIPFNKHSEERVDISDEPGYKREDIVLLSDDIPGYNRERGVLKAFLNRAYQKGLIAGTTQVLAKAGANIIDLQQHTAKDIETFFLRAVFDIEADGIPEVKRHNPTPPLLHLQN